MHECRDAAGSSSSDMTDWKCASCLADVHHSSQLRVGWRVAGPFDEIWRRSEWEACVETTGSGWKSEVSEAGCR